MSILSELKIWFDFTPVTYLAKTFWIFTQWESGRSPFHACNIVLTLTTLYIAVVCAQLFVSLAWM